MRISVIGAGLAGCEAANQLTLHGFDVDLYEMKPQKFSPAHHYEGFAELVCSNSLKASRLESASGLLKAEMKILGSLILECAEKCAVAAGGALAVDRTAFSDAVTNRIRSNPKIRVIEGEVTEIPKGKVIIATGPLTSDAFAEKISELCGSSLSFYDAAAPIVTYESIDKDKVFLASRYGRGEADYINCPFEKDEYLAFYKELINAQTAELKEFEKQSFKVYEGCMPIEVLAKRGEDSMRFGPLKPVGLTNPKTGKRPYANLQLRRENAEGTLFNLVGFQTNLKFGEQKRVFSMIPGLESAEFMRYGVMHRNTYLNSPMLLDEAFCLKSNPDIYFAGQITGVEGYVESAASGIVAGISLSRDIASKDRFILPPQTMLGALARHVSSPNENYQPMGANMGILPKLDKTIKGKQERYLALANRAVSALADAVSEYGEVNYDENNG